MQGSKGDAKFLKFLTVKVNSFAWEWFAYFSSNITNLTEHLSAVLKEKVNCYNKHQQWHYHF